MKKRWGLLSTMLIGLFGLSMVFSTAFASWSTGASETPMLDIVSTTTQVTDATDHVTAHKAVAKIGTTYYTSIERAVADANSTSSGTTIYVIPGTNPTIKKSFTMNSNVTLILPYSGDTYYTKPVYTTSIGITMPDDSTNMKLKVTVASGVTITCSGKIIVGGTIVSGNGGGKYSGNTYGPFAQLTMSDNSKIICNSGAEFTVYGYVTEATKHSGDYADDEVLTSWPQITLNSGSKVSAPFAIHDYRGGSITSGLYSDRNSKHTMFFNEYEIMNIHPLMNFAYGSQLLVSTWMSASSTPYGAENIKLIGNSSSYFFEMKSGSVLNFKYNYSANEATDYGNRYKNFMDIRLHGDFAVNSMTLSVAGTSMATSAYRFAIGYSFHLRFYGGTTSINNMAKMMAGSKIYVASDATLKLGDLAIYRSYVDSSSNGHTSYPSAAPAPVFENNGIVEATNLAGVVTSKTAAATLKVTSSTSITCYEHLSSSGSSFFTSVTYTTLVETLSVYLVEDGKVSSSLSDIGTGTYHSYEDSSSKVGWFTENGVLSYNTNGSSDSYSSKNITIGASGYLLTSSDLSNTPSRLHYTFDGWYLDAALTKKAMAGTAVFASIVLNAKWTPVNYSITYSCPNFYNGDPVGEAIIYDSRNPSSFNIETPAASLYPATCGENIFDGWYTDSGFTNKVSAISGSMLSSMSSPYNLTLYGRWYSSDTETYVITFSNDNTDEGCTCVESQEVISTAVDTFVAPDLSGKNGDQEYQKYFEGWYLDSNWLTKYTSPSQITGSMTLYAHWTNKCAVTIVWPGNTFVNLTLYVPKNFSFTIPNASSYGVTIPTGYQAAWDISGGPLDGETHYQGERITLTDDWGQNITVSGRQEKKTLQLTITCGSNETIEYKVTRSSSVVASGTVAANSSAKVNVQLGDLVSLTIKPSSNYSAGTVSNTKGCSGTLSSGYTINGENPSITVANATSSGGGSCVLPNTLVTMADGSRRPIKEIQPGDMLRVFDHETGQLVVSPAIFNESEEATWQNVIYLEFANGTKIGVISEHGFFDMDTRRYEYIHEDNFENFVGHSFYTEEGEKTRLIKAYMKQEWTECYSVPSYYHIDLFTEGLLSMPGGAEGFFNIFEYGEDVRYDQEAYQRDIETYGLCDYEEFAAFGISQEMFDAYAGKYIKIALGKGVLTEEQLAYLVERYGHYAE